MSTDPEAVSMTVHSQPTSASLVSPERTRGGRIRMLLIMAACAAPVIASYFTFFVIQPKGQAYSELITPMRDLPPDLPLQDLQGKPVQAASLKGQWLLIAVQGAACDAACDKQLFMQRQLREMLGKERDKLDKVWLIPDSEPVSAAALQGLNQGADATVLRVPKAALETWLAPAAGHQLNEHLFVVDPMGNWMMRTPAQAEPGKVKRDLDRLLRAAASWDRAGR
ncbi:hypothetical protein [Roseateles toxinivorans]|uniref:Cytochrome oxidase Cu insertion factor (SCO1/SenC/PrrC family) n=1 Tax=Roseateles toxinivorans TaxID=270368 RepID=A0A4R6QLK3_9BURK|nr:hypothetical protein [Roseateles toxinivorans]TDP71369.1 cytochrome oxidase Cu insertion factor (SCO1/SenC/PrrC family) [Roseateles toxinivorans]